jgi:radical SAM protein with 4Fe4S-binding SPASM domain
MSKRFYLQWHITNQCGNRCVHCYQQGNYGGPEVTHEKAVLILEDFLSLCSRLNADSYLAITGGDPFLNRDFKPILTAASSKCFWVSILANPENVTEQNLEWLEELKIRFFQVSLDGLEGTHDSIRYQGSFRKTLEAVKRLARSSIKPMVMSTVSALNYKEMPAVMEEVYAAGAKRWSFARWTPPGIGDCGMKPDEYMSFLREISKIHKKFEAEGHDPVDKDPLTILINEDECPASSQKSAGGCGIGSSVLTLLPDDTVMACRRHPGSVLGKWTPENNFLYHFALNPRMNEFRQFEKIEGCGSCKFLRYCRGCRAAAYSATGNHFGRDPQCPLA